jgi:hypothetical protein
MGTLQMMRSTTLAALGAAALLAAAAVAPARGQTPASCDASAYRLGARSLTGGRGTGAQLVIRVRTPEPTCALPDTLDDLRAAIGRRVVHYSAVKAPGGVATVRLGRVQRLQRVSVTVVFGSQVTLSGVARTLLKPDLVLRAVIAPKSRLTAKPFTVVAPLGQPTRDVAVTATVSVSVSGTVVGTATARVGPRRRAAVRVPVTLTALGRTPVSVTATADLPETSKRNNARRTSVEVTEFQVTPARVLVPSLAGYGGQFNEHVYAKISRDAGVTDANVGDMEQKMKQLRPEFSRIFFTPLAFGDPDRMQSFVRTVQLAQTAGATINITWQGGNLDVAGGNVQRFANVLIDLVKNRGITNLRWLTLQNEPNRTRLTPEQVEA